MPTFNVSLGEVKTRAQLPAANDALLVVPLEAAGLIDDATMADYTTLAEILAGTSNEQVTMGRKTITTVTSTVNNTDNRYEADFDDLVWLAATGNPVGALVVCYDPDTTVVDDATLQPLTWVPWAFTPDGSDVTATVNDFFRASNPA